MRVYLIAAEGDADVAEACEDFLKRHGCLVRVATGRQVFHPAHPGEMTVALWSLKTRMSANQIIFTNRAIDAYVDGSLVVGQLDFHPLPFGLTDVQPYDLRAPGMRNMRFQQMLAELRKIERARLNPIAPRASTDTNEAADGVFEQSDNDKIDVFVSYAFSNSEIVLPLVTDMETTGADIWIAKDEIKPGAGWAGEIVRAIKAAHLFCVMCSAQSFASDHVRREIYLADKYSKPILPVLLDGTLMPEDIEYFLIDRQWLDMTKVDFERRADLLREAIAA